MNFERGKTRHAINGRLRCNKESCRKSISIYSGTIFENLRIPLGKAIRSLYLYSFNHSFANIAQEMNVNKKTISNFIKKYLTYITILIEIHYMGSLDTN
ncbi:Phosphotyrosine-binding domain [Conglomerata obtusa]